MPGSLPTAPSIDANARKRPTMTPREHSTSSRAVRSAPPVAPPVVKAAIPPAPPAKPDPAKAWDKDPIDLELEELAKGIDLQFESPTGLEEKADVELERTDDDKKHK